MIEVQSRFEKDSKEWNEMEYRIACGQLYQQEELDKIKGIKATTMPKHWYNIKFCEDDYQKSLCADKKPYFFMYNYDYIKSEYREYLKSNDTKCMIRFKCTVKELIDKDEKTEQEEEFLKWYEKGINIGFGNCAMNKICYYIEKEFNGYKYQLKHNNLFDYNKLKVNRRCTEKHRQELKELCDEYVELVAKYKSDKKRQLESSGASITKESNEKREKIKQTFRNRAKEICPSDDERLNIILDMCYGYKNNKQFCWDCIGDLIIKRLEEMNNE